MNPDDLRALEEAAEREEARERRRNEQEETARARDEEKRTAAAEAQRERAGRPPTGFARSMHAFYVLLASMTWLAFLIAAASEGDLRACWPYFAAGLAVIAIYALVAWYVLSTWRRRLTFALEGFDRIAGDDSTDARHVAWIAFRVKVELRAADDDTLRAVAAALAVLVARGNAALASEKSMNATSRQRWRTVSGREVAGEGTQALYTTGVLRRWLTGEMSDVGRGGGAVASVRVSARYTGKAYRDPDLDS